MQIAACIRKRQRQNGSTKKREENQDRKMVPWLTQKSKEKLPGGAGVEEQEMEEKGRGVA